MKSIVALIGLIAVVGVQAITPEQKTQAQTYVQKCKAEVGIDADSASQIRGGNFDIDSRKAQCFVKCFFKLTGFMDENDKPQRDVIIKKLAAKHNIESAIITEIVDKCIKEKGDDGCETAYKIFECYRTNRQIKNSFPSYTKASSGSTTPSSVSTTPTQSKLSLPPFTSSKINSDDKTPSKLNIGSSTSSTASDSSKSAATSPSPVSAKSNSDSTSTSTSTTPSSVAKTSNNH